jgi:hypothetical protein
MMSHAEGEGQRRETVYNRTAAYECAAGAGAFMRLRVLVNTIANIINAPRQGLRVLINTVANVLNAPRQVLRVLVNFAERAEPGRSRTDYMAVLAKVCACACVC